MGSRGYGPLGRVLLGGVASQVIRKAACPVIVTPRPAEPAPANP
jgi:nucleotide-binding universal stress UspA family protein